MKFKTILKSRWKWGVIVVTVGLLATGMLVYIFRDLPNPQKLATDDYAESSQLFDRKGRLLFEFYGDRDRVSVKLSSVPDSLKKATLAIEDANFYNHNGFDLKGIIRGLVRTVFMRRLQGGSTLTQQLVKNALLSPERTITRKIKEAVLTMATEALYNKDQIFEMYFNQTPYGGTLWGAEAASRGIFNKHVEDLTLAESALIAGLPGSPTYYSPFTHADAAKKRQELVLTRMNELGFISTQEMESAKKEKLNYFFGNSKIEAPHFVFYLKELLNDKYGKLKVNEGGLKVISTLDLDMQTYIQATVAAEIAKITKMKVTNGAVLVTEPKTGNILAMVGSKNYFADDVDGKYNVTTASRQPGSSIKPLNYAVGIELGKVTAASIFDDRPTCFKQVNLKDYCPVNYGGAYHGIQTLRNSLGNSLNIPAVKMLKLNGLETFVASASAMGITTYVNPAEYGLSITLGGGEVKMVDMNTAFGVLANAGTKQSLNAILRVTDRRDQLVDEYVYSPGERVLSRETSFIIQQIMSDDGARGMVFGRGSMLNIKGHPEVAVKTGTTNDMKDNWTVGFTPDYVVTVWVGNNDNTKMSGLVSGTTGAAPIWNKVMSYLLAGKPVKKWVQPTGVIGTTVCNLTGELAPEEGCEMHYEYFKKEFVPTSRTKIRQSILIDKDTGLAVQPGENRPNVEWQDHSVVRDVMGVMVCLDCQSSATTPVVIN